MDFRPNGNQTKGETKAALNRIKRVLVIADSTFQGSDFLNEIKECDGRVDANELRVLVVAPALPESPLDAVATDIDGPILDAYRRLGSILGELRRVGIVALGMIGDGDPVTAVGDGLRSFDAGDLIFVGHTEAQAGYAERDLWEKLKRVYEGPIHALMVDTPNSPDEAAKLVEIRRTAPPGVPGIDGQPFKNRVSPRGTDGGIASSRDLFGMGFGILGTVALGYLTVIAADMTSFSFGDDLPAAVVAMLLLALAAFLLNLASGVTLLMFMSTGYRGTWERIVARIAVGFTAACLVASSLILFLLD